MLELLSLQGNCLEVYGGCTVPLWALKKLRFITPNPHKLRLKF